MNQSNQETAAEQKELANALVALDDISITALLAVARGMLEGKPIAEAYEDGNIILVANGRRPYSYKEIISFSSASKVC